MIHSRRFRSSAILIPALFLLPACSTVSSMFSSGSDDASFVQVDDLLGRVERVHVDCELAGQNVSMAIETLMNLVGPEFRGNPELAYNDFVTAIEVSVEQATKLRKDYEPMQSSADSVFDRWTTDLEGFSSEVMREHSEKRMTSARERYEMVVSTVDPTILAYEDFNRALRDHALYLGNDFSSDSVAVIERELRDLSARASELTTAFEKATLACQEFVRKGALRGQVTSGSLRDV